MSLGLPGERDMAGEGEGCGKGGGQVRGSPIARVCRAAASGRAVTQSTHYTKGKLLERQMFLWK